MRKTGFSDVEAPVVVGDAEVGELLARSLAAAGEVDRFTHGFHTYPAGLHPDAAALLVNAFPGAVLDPFCGGGTVIVEARAAGRRGVGRDVSPVARLVATARTATPDEGTLTLLRSTSRRLTEAARQATDLPPPKLLGVVEQWYAPHALRELESLRRGIADAPPEVRDLLWCCFSSILIKVSWRKSDTSPQRVKHHRPPGTTAILFHKKARELARRCAALRDGVPAGTPEADIALEDARSVRVQPPVDAVITSPPYPSTYDYLPLQHLRSVWLGLAEGQGEIGARRYWRQGERAARRRWLEDTRDWTARVAHCLSPGGALVVVIGDGLTPQGTVDTSQPTEDAGKAAGLRLVARASVERADHARGTTRWEHAFAFRKSS